MLHRLRAPSECSTRVPSITGRPQARRWRMVSRPQAKAERLSPQRGHQTPRCRRRDVGANRAACISRCFEALAACPPRHGSAETTLGTVSLIPCMDRRCRLRRGFPRMLRASIWPLAFAAMNDAGAAACGAGPHVKSVSDVAATAIVTDHAWPQNLDSVDACEPITLTGFDDRF